MAQRYGPCVDGYNFRVLVVPNGALAFVVDEPRPNSALWRFAGVGLFLPAYFVYPALLLVMFSKRVSPAADDCRMGYGVAFWAVRVHMKIGQLGSWRKIAISLTIPGSE